MIVVVVDIVDLDDMLIVVIVDYGYIMIIFGYLVCGNFILGLVCEVNEDGLISLFFDVGGCFYIMIGYVNGFNM